MHDIIIIGSGIAGSYIAAKLKKFDVIVLEKDGKTKIKDSGIVSKDIFNFFHGNELIKDKINRINIVSQSKTVMIETEKPFSYILEREKFSEFLRSRIEDKIAFETAREVKQFDGYVSVKTNKGEHSAKMLIGADGANSMVRKIITEKNPTLCTGIMSTNGTELYQDCINVYLNKYYSPDFFSWAIPQNNEYGLITAIRPKEYFDYFVKKMNFPNGKVFASSIPIGTTKSYSNRVLLVGDACGQIKPITGGGIIFSLKAASHAIDIIKSAFGEDKFDEEMLKYYEWNWKRDFGYEIKRQLFLRNMYRNMTNRQIDKALDYFGPATEIAVKLEDFDYDMLSNLWTKMPKFKLLKFLLEYYTSS